MGRDEQFRPGTRYVLVSIHAPAWGATNRNIADDAEPLVSIHAPAWGATDLKSQWYITKKVSIHAPAWGATFLMHLIMGGFPLGFNPRARMGRDHYNTVQSVGHVLFQSTRPHWARQFIAGKGKFRRLVSIHAPAWGATVDSEYAGQVIEVSIHAPAWGATLFCCLGSVHRWCCFNPRARMGRDILLGSVFVASGGFNPRARMGRDRRSAPWINC